MTYLKNSSYVGLKILKNNIIKVKFRFKLDHDNSDQIFMDWLSKTKFIEDRKMLNDRILGCNREDIFKEFIKVELGSVLAKVNDVNHVLGKNFVYSILYIETLQTEMSKDFFNNIKNYKFMIRAIGTESEENQFKITNFFGVDACLNK